MVKKSTVFIGKGMRVATRLRGGGSALPGLTVEKIDKDFLKKALGKLPRGVVVISGTNGKTTTAKIVTELLESQGLNVFTNSTGSNFKRGVISALISEMDMSGKLTADIAVLELDEAHALHFIKEVKPRYSLLLNVMRDQLDRFGEIDNTADLLRQIAEATTGTVVLNREDPRIVRINDNLDQEVHFFGYDQSVASMFPSDDDLYGKAEKPTYYTAGTILKSAKDQTAIFKVGAKEYEVNLQLNGIYNIYNAAGAICLVRAICGEKLDEEKLFKRLSTVTAAFGRGEMLSVNGQPLQLILVKNPVSFRLGLKSFSKRDVAIMIVINDQYADGRDMSWLWDVDFSSLAPRVDVVSGSRAYDMALRLQYDEVQASEVEPDLKLALDNFAKVDGPKQIFCTYTAMLQLRKLLNKYAEVERVL